MAFLFFLSDGHGFVIGCILLFMGTLLSFNKMKKVWTNIVQLCTVAGMILIIISGTPLPAFIYIFWFLLIINVLGFQNSEKEWQIKLFPIIRGVTSLFCIIVFLFEWPYLKAPVVPRNDLKVMYVIGDSVSAGIHKDELTWVKIIKENHGINIINLAQGGVGCREAISQAQKVRQSNALVLIEIGGNDLFNGVALDEYEASMEKILQILSNKNCVLIMFDLPVPPLKNYFSETQRRLAKKYNVTLIPKRYLTSILSPNENKLDYVHLSSTGHQKMAELVWEIIKPALYKKIK